MSIESVMPSNHLILLSPSPPAFHLSQREGLFQWVSSNESSGGQSTGASASALVLMNIQDWFPLGLTDLISWQSKGLSSLLQHQCSKAPILQCSAFLVVQLSHPYMTIGKTIALIRWDFHLVAQWYFKEANSFHLCSVFPKVSFNLGLAFLVFTRCSPTARMWVTFFLVQAEWLGLT